MSNAKHTTLEEESSSEHRESPEPQQNETVLGSNNTPEPLLKSGTSVDKMQLVKCNRYELLCTVCVGLIFIALHYVPGKLKNALYIAFVGISFGSYIVYKMKRYGYRLILHDWGLTFNNFKISFLCCTIVAIIGICAMLIYMAIFKSALPFHYDLVLMLLLYPLWGIIQQFLIQALIAVNLSKLNWNYYLVIFLTACSFTLVHFPDGLLMLATFCVGLTFTPIFLEYKCLYPLGIYHGWCGALFYWLVLTEDPMQRF